MNLDWTSNAQYKQTSFAQKHWFRKLRRHQNQLWWRICRTVPQKTSWRLWKAAVLVAVKSIAVKARSNRWQAISWQDPIIWNITIVVLTVEWTSVIIISVSAILILHDWFQILWDSCAWFHLVQSASRYGPRELEMRQLGWAGLVQCQVFHH